GRAAGADGAGIVVVRGRGVIPRHKQKRPILGGAVNPPLPPRRPPRGAGAHAGKSDALRHLVALDAGQAPEEIEMPPRTAELAVGDGLEPDLLLLADEPGDLAVFDVRQGRGGAFAALPPPPPPLPTPPP